MTGIQVHLTWLRKEPYPTIPLPSLLTTLTAPVPGGLIPVSIQDGVDQASSSIRNNTNTSKMNLIVESLFISNDSDDSDSEIVQEHRQPEQVTSNPDPQTFTNKRSSDVIDLTDDPPIEKRRKPTSKLPSSGSIEPNPKRILATTQSTISDNLIGKSQDKVIPSLASSGGAASYISLTNKSNTSINYKSQYETQKKLIAALTEKITLLQPEPSLKFSAIDEKIRLLRLQLDSHTYSVMDDIDRMNDPFSDSEDGAPGSEAPAEKLQPLPSHSVNVRVTSPKQSTSNIPVPSRDVPPSEVIEVVLSDVLLPEQVINRPLTLIPIRNVPRRSTNAYQGNFDDDSLDDDESGLLTPTQERDDGSDLGSFIEYDNDNTGFERHQYRENGLLLKSAAQLSGDFQNDLDLDQSYQESDDNDDEGQETDFSGSQLSIANTPNENTKNELNNLRLSPDVADKFGITYGQFASSPTTKNKNKNHTLLPETIELPNDNYDDDDDPNKVYDSEIEEIEDFTTQLNQERELDVIDLLSQDDDIDEDEISVEKPGLQKYEDEEPSLECTPQVPNSIIKSNPNTQTKSQPPLFGQVLFVESDEEEDDEFNNDIALNNLLQYGQPNSPPKAKSMRPPAPPGSEYFIEEVYQVLQNTFHLQGFRSNQLEAVCSTLQGNDTFVLMPTGGGKSLCYQLPALVQKGKTSGTTIVISPLISLMQDQVSHLTKLGVNAGMISSKATAEENRQITKLFRNGEMDIVYLSPEKVNNSKLIQSSITKLYEDQKLARVVIDEAHCLLSWGHDFRPDYKGMSLFKLKYPTVPIMALTATANDMVQMDIIHHLHMSNPKFLKQSFNRTNLTYYIKWKLAGYLDWIRQYISQEQRGCTGIIYCHSKQSCEQTSEKMNQGGVRLAFYHAGMLAQDRFQVQEEWQNGTIQVICATIAFGMGIDKPNVRFVIHLFIPRSLEGYYQETGRAGRDGDESDCIMFYSYKDARTLQLLIQRDEELSEDSKEHHLEKLRQVVQYCENNHDCRRKVVLQYFNEQFDPEQCRKKCDNCINNSSARDGDVVIKDVTVFAKQVLGLVRLVQHEKVTVIQCQDIFRGSQNSKIVSMGHNLNPFHGKGKSLDKLDIERIFFYLLSENCLEEYQIFKKNGFALTYVKIGKRANEVLEGDRHITLNSNNAPPSSKSSSLSSKQGLSLNRATRAHSMPTTKSGNNLLNFRYSESFITARQAHQGTSRSVPDHTDASRIDINTGVSSEYVTKAFDELSQICRSKAFERNIPPSKYMDRGDLILVATLLPTTKRDFIKLLTSTNEGVAKEVLEEKFIWFKKTLIALSKERRKALGGEISPNISLGSINGISTQTQQPLTTINGQAASENVSPFFQLDFSTTSTESAYERQITSYQRNKASLTWKRTRGGKTTRGTRASRGSRSEFGRTQTSQRSQKSQRSQSNKRGSVKGRGASTSSATATNFINAMPL